LKADTPSSLPQAFSLTHPKGMEGSVLYFGCCCGQGGIGSVGLGAECGCEDVTQKVGTTILFRCIHSGDTYQPLNNVGFTQPSS